jgi:CBS domain containing-hemolysin-like protein
VPFPDACCFQLDYNRRQMSILSLLAVPFLIALNAFFVAAEYAVLAIRPGDVESLRASEWKGVVGAIDRLKNNPASTIGTIQVCITMTNLLLGWIGEPAMSALLEKMFGPLVTWSPRTFTAISVALSFLIVTLLTVVLSELLPKALTLRFASPAAILTAIPVTYIQTFVSPLVWLMNKIANSITRPLGLGRVEEFEKQTISADELKVLANQAAADGVVTHQERQIILASLSLGRRKAKEIMVHRSQVQFIDVNRSMDENKQIVDSALHSRFPLCQGELDKAIGVLSAKDFLTAYHAGGDTSMLQLIAHPPVFVPDMISLDRLLSHIRENHAQMVFLVNEYGSVQGLVTLQDLVDELVGVEQDHNENPPA